MATSAKRKIKTFECPACSRITTDLVKGVCIPCFAEFQKEHAPKRDKKRDGEAKTDYESTPLDDNSEHVGSVSFNLEEVLHNLGEESNDQQRIEDSKRLGAAIGKILDWLIAVDLDNKHALRAIGMRTVAMAWVVDPKRFDNASVRTLATKLGFSAPNISPLTAEFSRQFTINNQFQNHDWRKGKTHEQH